MGSAAPEFAVQFPRYSPKIFESLDSPPKHGSDSPPHPHSSPACVAYV